jgi:hypothetical protein
MSYNSQCRVPGCSHPGSDASGYCVSHFNSRPAIVTSNHEAPLPEYTLDEKVKDFRIIVGPQFIVSGDTARAFLRAAGGNVIQAAEAFMRLRK